jgi:hypothetical protein
MKYKIDTYREQEIFYNEDSDKFEVEILTNEELQPKYSKRASLVDVKKSIDDHFKRNANFKPCKAIYAPYSVIDAYEVTITAIRKDGGITIEKANGEKQQLVPNKYSDFKNNFYKYSELYLKDLAATNRVIEELERQIKVVKSDVINRAPEKLNFSFINDYL